MLKINKTSKIYIHCPAGVVTGGTELLHQLEDYLVRHGLNAYIFYYSYWGDVPHKVPEAFSKYSIVKEENIEDNEDNIEIFNETEFIYLHRCHKTQKAIWWMSVDNFFMVNKCAIFDFLRWDLKRGSYKALKNIRDGLKAHRLYRGIHLRSLATSNIIHLYQSEYARQFLIGIGAKDIAPLSDYINQDFVENAQDFDKENVVLYNPAKGFKFTHRLIQLAPDIKWVALRGFSRSELVNVLRSSKVYIDFGNHPGKDRLPRECAMNGCVIITGKRGAAKYKEDVFIDDEFKFDETPEENIIEKIRDIFSNYDANYSKQKAYRERIIKEKAIFESEINDLFLIKK